MPPIVFLNCGIQWKLIENSLAYTVHASSLYFLLPRGYIEQYIAHNNTNYHLLLDWVETISLCGISN